MEKSYDTLPYRPCVGAMVLNSNGEVLVGSRIDGGTSGDGSPAWQMPQGGIDEDEDPYAAVLRELEEETNITSVVLHATLEEWLYYDVPKDLASSLWAGRYRGQKQRWFAFSFVGDEREIDVHEPAGGTAKPEFHAWAWRPMRMLPMLVVPFKRPVYEQVVAAFEHLVPAKPRS